MFEVIGIICVIAGMYLVFDKGCERYLVKHGYGRDVRW